MQRSTSSSHLALGVVQCYSNLPRWHVPSGVSLAWQSANAGAPVERPLGHDGLQTLDARTVPGRFPEKLPFLLRDFGGRSRKDRRNTETVILYSVRGNRRFKRSRSSRATWDPGPQYGILHGHPDILEDEKRRFVVWCAGVDHSFASSANCCQLRRNPSGRNPHRTTGTGANQTPPERRPEEHVCGNCC